MNDYKTFTNSELEEEMARLKREYSVAQKVTLENYQLMMQLAKMYGEAEDVINMRNGKKKD